MHQLFAPTNTTSTFVIARGNFPIAQNQNQNWLVPLNTVKRFDDTLLVTRTWACVSDVTPSLTLLMPEAALVVDAPESIDSLELALLTPDGGSPRLGCTAQLPGLRLEGDLLTFETGAKRPKFGRHWKYLRPRRENSADNVGKSSRRG